MSVSRRKGGTRMNWRDFDTQMIVCETPVLTTLFCILFIGAHCWGLGIETALRVLITMT